MTRTLFSLSRRNWLKTTAAGALLAGSSGGRGWAQETARTKPGIALQLYSVRDDCARDLPATLAAVAKMGYEGVEFAGYHGRSAKELRQLLDDLGLRCCGTHIGLHTLLGEELPRTVEFNRIDGRCAIGISEIVHDASHKSGGRVRKISSVKTDTAFTFSCPLSA